MRKLALLFGLLAGTAQAATVTYEIEPSQGEFIDGIYGDREAIRALYEEELSRNADEYQGCQTQGYGQCDTALIFEDYRVRGHGYAGGAPISFDEYYLLHTDAAGHAGDINIWRSGGLTISARSYGGFYPRGYGSGILEFGYVLDGGDSDGPSWLQISIPETEMFTSIDLRVTPWSFGTVNDARIETGFNGTYHFGSEFADLNLITINAGPIDWMSGRDVGYMYFDNIVTTSRAVAAVPLPGSLAMLGAGLFSLVGIRRRRRKTA